MVLQWKEWIQNEKLRKILFLILSGASLLVSLCFPGELRIDAAWVAIVLCGIPILMDAATGLYTRFDIKADLLVSLALIASVIIGEIFAAGEVAFIMQIGSFLEETTVARARAGLEKLIRLTPRVARRLAGGTEETIPAEAVEVGDTLRVLPGETIPVDGVILRGESSIDQSVVTGESMPVEKQPCDEVFSGTVNRFGTFEMKAEKRDSDSAIQRMVRLVQSADAGKARIVGLADRWATWIVVIALLAALGVWCVTGEVIRSVTILVVFCPCALVLATPTAIMAAIGNATRHGILIREGDALERLAAVKRMMLDKTGTLTCGTPKVVALYAAREEMKEMELYRLAAAAELRSEHPLGKAVVNSCRETHPELEIPQPDSFELFPGRGVAAQVEGRHLLAGRPELLEGAGIAIPAAAREQAEQRASEGATVIHLAADGEFCGLVALADVLRENAAPTIAEVRARLVRPTLLTGDNRNAALHIAKAAGIDEVHSDCLPEEKLEIIDRCQQAGEPVCMIGDGINDAPALKKAFVGIAMGGIGSDIAVEAADIALVDDDIRQLPFLLQLAKRTMTTIRLNLTFSMALNFIAIVLAGMGILNPVAGALVHNAGSVAVVLNSALLLSWKGGSGRKL